ncbi:hypothetical protein CNX65_34045 [Actinosynnema pretiosum]|uniref:Uncharacterized protein n=1 Tax=Actinosynnema pretiosum TaxID=42197 RepID=A0A290ZFC5_9PSEU|nr:hypothetical protein CNX65_34045 [Actinosynnema pretiosum]
MLVVVDRRALPRAAALTGAALLALLTACGSPQAAPAPAATTTTAKPAPTTVLVPQVDISVRPAPTAARPTAAGTTTPPPPPAPTTTAPPPASAPAPTTTTSAREDTRRYDQIALGGFPCAEVGTTAVDPTGRRLVCQAGPRGWLRWEG